MITWSPRLPVFKVFHENHRDMHQTKKTNVFDFSDCTAPFVVHFHTNAASDANSAIAPAGRGIFSDLKTGTKK